MHDLLEKGSPDIISRPTEWSGLGFRAIRSVWGDGGTLWPLSRIEWQTEFASQQAELLALRPSHTVAEIMQIDFELVR
jgi:hypothetical protein